MKSFKLDSVNNNEITLISSDGDKFTTQLFKASMSTIPAWFWTKGNTSKALVEGHRYLVKRVCEEGDIFFNVERPDILDDGSLYFPSQGGWDIGHRKVVAFIKIEEE